MSIFSVKLEREKTSHMAVASCDDATLEGMENMVVRIVFLLMIWT